MAGTKYGKYVIKAPTKEIAHYTGHSIVAHDGELTTDCSIGYHCIAKPWLFDKSHAHDFTELLCFIGGNILDVRDLDAEIEICLGEEQEKHIITAPTIVSIPPGLVHCPLNIRKVTKPFVFLEISLTPKYGKSGDKK
jgi:hypothetical protein